MIRRKPTMKHTWENHRRKVDLVVYWGVPTRGQGWLDRKGGLWQEARIPVSNISWWGVHEVWSVKTIEIILGQSFGGTTRMQKEKKVEKLSTWNQNSLHTEKHKTVAARKPLFRPWFTGPGRNQPHGRGFLERTHYTFLGTQTGQEPKKAFSGKCDATLWIVGELGAHEVRQGNLDSRNILKRSLCCFQNAKVLYLKVKTYHGASVHWSAAHFQKLVLHLEYWRVHYKLKQLTQYIKNNKQGKQKPLTKHHLCQRKISKKWKSMHGTPIASSMCLMPSFQRHSKNMCGRALIAILII